jgi:2-oxoglutarate dehydrogenase E2 component (dihydrolipoamide succinyltransferase)
MAVAIKIPGVGESITEGIIARWLKPDGSTVKAGEPLFELETDKASNVVPAEASGTLKITVAEGATVPIGSTVGTIDPDGTTIVEAATPKTTEPTKPKAETRQAERPASGATPVSPSARRLATEEGVDTSKVTGTGRGGRITKGDVFEHLADPPASAPPAAPAPAAATPAAARPAPGPRPRATRTRMTTIRQKIAQRLIEAQQTAAILTTFNEADMTRIMDLRAKYKDVFNKKHSVNLGFMSFFVKACVEALKAFPAVNGRIEGSDLVLNNVYDIGVAVSTERGLMVPVIRDADRLSFAEIEKAIGAYATKARDGSIAVTDLQGGTFTITNGGVFGSLLSTPIINPPQSGILGMHAIQKRPVAIDDQVVIRPMMYLALSYDHRIVDGREAVSFLVRIKECVENPERLMLEI